jgi:phenazine biosynthesis protein phzE
VLARLRCEGANFVNALLRFVADPKEVDELYMVLDEELKMMASTPMLAICLGHQVLAAELGLPLHRRCLPYQGLQREIHLFGTKYRVGFYATFTALSDTDALRTPYGEIELSRDGADGAVHALRGRSFAGVQFHPSRC